MKKLISIAVLLFAALAMQAQTYVDLGLPSGTKWVSANAPGFYTYDEAVRLFGSCLPTAAQFEELLSECDSTWIGSGYKFTSRRNGNSIFLPAAGSSDGHCVGYDGEYWSSTIDDYESAYNLEFWRGRSIKSASSDVAKGLIKAFNLDSSRMYVTKSLKDFAYSVRLVQNK